MDAAVREAVAAAPKVSAEEGWVAAARQVMESGFVVFDGRVFDQFSASAMIQVHDALSAANQARFAAMPVQQAQAMAFAVIKKASG